MYATDFIVYLFISRSEDYDEAYERIEIFTKVEEFWLKIIYH